MAYQFFVGFEISNSSDLWWKKYMIQLKKKDKDDLGNIQVLY